MHSARFVSLGLAFGAAACGFALAMQSMSKPTALLVTPKESSWTISPTRPTNILPILPHRSAFSLDSEGQDDSNYFILALGCIQLPGMEAPCQNPPETDWGMYMSFLQRRYGFSLDENGKKKYQAWANSHIKYVQAPDFDPKRIQAAVDAIQPRTGKIFLFGHSAGGVAVINYLMTLEQNPTLPIPPIGGAYAIHAPLGDSWRALVSVSMAWLIEFPKIECGMNGYCPVEYPRSSLIGLGAWAEQRDIALQIISYQDDVVNPHHQVADIPFYQYPSDPAYQAKPYEFAKKHGYLMSYYDGVQKMLGQLFEQGLLK